MATPHILLLVILAAASHFVLGSANGNNSTLENNIKISLAFNPSQLSINPVQRITIKEIWAKPAPQVNSTVLLKGLVALGAASRLHFPPGHIPSASPAFSFSICIFLTEDSTGAIRTIFSKGRNSNQRTPTLALLKNSRRLLFKTTTLFRPEISATSSKQLPLFRWSHVTLTSDGYQTLTLFLDGEADGTLYTDRDVILANEGPFTLGKDYVYDGAAALVSGLKFFPYELDGKQVRKEAREALSNLPKFEILAQEEARLTGAGSEAAWKPTERIIEESEFVWRGVVAGSPPAVDTPHFEGLLSGGVASQHNDEAEKQDADAKLFFAKLRSRHAFLFAPERTCPLPDSTLQAVLAKAAASIDSGLMCLEGDRPELTDQAESRHFWELIHINKREASTPAKVQRDGRTNSDLVEMFGHLALKRLSPFRTVAAFLQKLLSVLDILSEWEQMQEKENGQGIPQADSPNPLLMPDTIRDGAPAASKEHFYTGSPEGEKGYQTRVAQQQFEAGKAAAGEALLMAPSEDRHRRVREGLGLLRQAADAGVGLAHLEIAYVMAGQMENLQQSEQTGFAEVEDLGSDSVSNVAHQDSKGFVLKDRDSEEQGSENGFLSRGGLDQGSMEGGLSETGASGQGTLDSRVSIGGVSDKRAPSQTPVSLLLAPGGSGARNRGQEGAVSRNGTQLVPWQERITYHFLRAAALGVEEAFQALGYRSLYGFGTPQCNESARFFFERAAQVAVEAWQQPGDKTVVERSLLHGHLAVRMKERSNLADLLQLMARRGHREANLALGNWYLWGVHGMPRDHARAARHFERAHRAGIPHGTVGLAKMLMSGEGVAKNASKALEYYEDAAEKGDREALNGLGYLAFHGLGGMEQNLSKAFEYFKRAADHGSLDGLVNMGAMLRGGMGTPRDDVAAWGCFREGALAGHVPSAHQAALAASYGYGTERNPGLAAHFFRVVSETGPWARHLQAGLSAFLDGHERRALASYARAAELGYPPAQYNSAWLLEKRSRQLGSTRNEARLAAAVYHERLVEEGGGDEEGVRGVRADLRAWSHVRLGDCAYYEGGCGGRAASAAEHYRAAGELGSGQGQFSLAYLLERGTHGASRNLSDAERFYRLSGQQQNMGAAAAATLAIGKLKVLMLMERYEEHGAVVWRWVGPIYTWSQNVCEVMFKSLWKAQEAAVQFGQRSLGRGKKDKTSEAEVGNKGVMKAGASYSKDAPVTKPDPALTEGVEKLRRVGLSEQGDSSYTGVLKALDAAADEWVILTLCVALGVTLGFKWMRRRSRRPSAQAVVENQHRSFTRT